MPEERTKPPTLASGLNALADGEHAVRSRPIAPLLCLVARFWRAGSHLVSEFQGQSPVVAAAAAAAATAAAAAGGGGGRWCGVVSLRARPGSWS